MKRTAWWMLSLVAALTIGYIAGRRAGEPAANDDARSAQLQQQIADSGRVALELRHQLDSLRVQVAAATTARDSLRTAADSLRARLKAARNRVRTTSTPTPDDRVISGISRSMTPVFFARWVRPQSPASDTLSARLKLPSPNALDDAAPSVPDRTVPYVRLTVDNRPAIAPKVVVQVVQLQDSVLTVDAAERAASDSVEGGLRTSLADATRLADAERARFDASQTLYEGSQATVASLRRSIRHEKRKSFLKGLGTGVIGALAIAGLASL